MIRQRTLRGPIHCSGIALHCGEKVSLTLRPAPEDSGITFLRKDLAGRPTIPALWCNAVESPYCTTLVGEDGARVQTIEHLMSAFAGCGVDNALVELDGPEVPIMDGSAAPFVFLLECAGVVEQEADRRAIRVLKTVEVSEPHRRVSLQPADEFRISFEIDFDNKVVPRQEFFVEVDEASYKRDVARARTFGFLRDVNRMRSMGLALGGSLDNAIVIGEESILNRGGLRYADEFVRHKVLDSVGDLLLMGGPLIGHFHGVRAGHSLTLKLMQALFADSDAWCWAVANAEPPMTGSTIPPARAVAAHA